jgi:hypothetical protein
MDQFSPVSLLWVSNLAGTKLPLSVGFELLMMKQKCDRSSVKSKLQISVDYTNTLVLCKACLMRMLRPKNNQFTWHQFCYIIVAGKVIR